MITGIKDYDEMPPIELPFKSERLKITINSLDGNCGNCDAGLIEVHGLIKEHNDCVDAKFSGLCCKCQTVNKFHVRWYPEEKRMLDYGPDGWRETPLHGPGFIETFFGWIKSIFGR